MKPIVLLLASLLSISGDVASKPVDNRTYIQSGPDGVFYARCTPKEATGTAGVTEIFKVGKERDEVVSHYDWYTPAGVILGWSPIAGKVGVMAWHDEAPAAGEKKVELSFYLGGSLLKSWTTADLVKLGAETMISHRGEQAVARILDCEQIPGTNQYVFHVLLGGNKTISFDILTGDVFHQ
jgi:hypothetical protein